MGFLVRWIAAVALATLMLGSGGAGARGEIPPERASHAIADIPAGELPREARATLALIERGGPFPYDRDGSVFRNFEKRLPLRERGYYREYTVTTPGLTHRGARRIVAGRGGEIYYTEDHYESFRRIRK